MPPMGKASDPKPPSSTPLWAFIRITRPWNVLIIGGSMWAIRCALVAPNHVPALSDFSFWITMCIMMLLAAGGNVINDYFDVQEDAINKPKKALVGRVISRRKTLFFHHFLTGMAVVMSAVMSWDERSVWPFVWTVVMATLLWGYSPWFKRRFLRGNVVIALLVGQLPFWAVIGEIMDAHSHPFFSSNDGITLMIYAALSAALTFLREVTKDLQDREGDALTGFDTLAVRWGAQRTWRLLDWTHGLFWIPLIATSFFASYAFEVRWIVLCFLLPFAGTHIQLLRRRLISISAWQKLTLSGGIVFLLDLCL
jgi:4-hydroxybenzoate polyprenyltransferase